MGESFMDVVQCDVELESVQFELEFAALAVLTSSTPTPRTRSTSSALTSITFKHPPVGGHIAAFLMDNPDEKPTIQCSDRILKLLDAFWNRLEFIEIGDVALESTTQPIYYTAASDVPDVFDDTTMPDYDYDTMANNEIRDAYDDNEFDRMRDAWADPDIDEEMNPDDIRMMERLEVEPIDDAALQQYLNGDIDVTGFGKMTLNSDVVDDDDDAAPQQYLNVDIGAMGYGTLVQNSGLVADNFDVDDELAEYMIACSRPDIDAKTVFAPVVKQNMSIEAIEQVVHIVTVEEFWELVRLLDLHLGCKDIHYLRSVPITIAPILMWENHYKYACRLTGYEFTNSEYFGLTKIEPGMKNVPILTPVEGILLLPAHITSNVISIEKPKTPKGCILAGGLALSLARFGHRRSTHIEVIPDTVIDYYIAGRDPRSDRSKATDNWLCVSRKRSGTGTIKIEYTSDYISCNGNYLHLKEYRTLSEILHDLPVDCCCIGTSQESTRYADQAGGNFWATRRWMHAETYKYNTLDTQTTEVDYLDELRLHMDEGYSVCIPGMGTLPSDPIPGEREVIHGIKGGIHRNLFHGGIARDGYSIAITFTQLLKTYNTCVSIDLRGLDILASSFFNIMNIPSARQLQAYMRDTKGVVDETRKLKDTKVREGTRDVYVRSVVSDVDGLTDYSNTTNSGFMCYARHSMVKNTLFESLKAIKLDEPQWKAPLFMHRRYSSVYKLPATQIYTNLLKGLAVYDACELMFAKVIDIRGGKYGKWYENNIEELKQIFSDRNHYINIEHHMWYKQEKERLEDGYYNKVGGVGFANSNTDSTPLD